jgi:signal transduction histidine kinase/ligand-binding sensor domain-containing protein/CheY-like chemotaxis protein/AraC-like DNA-binding protein
MFSPVKIRHSLCLLFLILTGPGAAADNPVWQTVRITSEQGLSNSAVNTVYRDSRGYMWFGSWDGLNRFDGKSIKSYYPGLFDSRAISNNIIRRILEDGTGNLWIVTERGINRYSHDMENFSSWFTGFPELALQEESLKAAQGPDGNIWVNAHGLGLFRFSPENDDFLPVSLDGLSDEDSKRITGFYCNPEELYILLEDSLIVLNSTTGMRLTGISVPDLLPGDNSATTASWFFEYNDEVVLAQGLREGGLKIIYAGSKKAFLLRQGDQGFRITALGMSAERDFLWLGTDDGNVFQLYPGESFDLRPVLHHLPELAGKKVKIWSILETPDDLLWIGTDGEGVFRSMLKPKPFFRIGRGEPSQRQLNHHIVRAIYEDMDGGLWVGTRGNGLNHIPFQEGETRYFNTSNGLTNDAVLSLREDNDEYLWIGHDGMGIDIMDLRTGTFYHFPEDLEGAEDLEFGSVYAICVDAFGQVWLGTSGYGVLGLNIRKEGGRFTLIDFMHISSENSGDPLQSNIVYSIVEEKPNILWLGTRGAGIYRLNTLTGQMENFLSAAPGKPGLSDNDVLSLYMDSGNFLWVGSSRGLTRVNINYTPFAFKSYTIFNGLPSNTIHAILEDGDGDIWVSTNKGLSKLITAEDRFLNFNIADGLQSNEYSDGAACHGQKTGNFYFGGVNGLNWFFPGNIITSRNAPKLLFTGLKVHNDPIIPGDSTGILSGNINDLDVISLKHNQNFFTIGFTTLNFINPDKNFLGYMLENFHADWVFLGDQREATFTNVPPGKYTLKVRATNEEGLWPDEARELLVIILPPFRKTLPAYLIYIVFISALIFALLRYHSRRVRRRQQRALEVLQQDREKELNQYKLEFFTNLAHEFGTPLTLIFASAASLLKPEKEPGETRALTQTIYKNSRRMQNIVQELLEFRKIETGREKLSLRQVELVDTLNNITETFSHFARENEIELSFEPEEEELFCLLDPMKVDKIMLNLLSNAIKNTPEGGSVTLGLVHSGQNIIIRVTDTGTGISSEAIPFIFDSYSQQTPGIKRNTRTFKGIGIGLAYTRSLVEIHGGNITVMSYPGKGSTFTVTLPMRIPDVPGESRSPAGDITARKNLFESVAEEFLNHNRHARSADNSRAALWTMPGKYKVLIAEDDPELSDLLYRMLSEQYDVYPVHDGLQALEIIRSKRIDVVISDVMMPGMDGLALCRAIKDDMLTSHIKVILLTVRSEIENLIEGLEMGADSYIPKPFHPRHLLVRTEKLLRSREQASDYFKKHFGTPAYKPEQKYSTRDRELLEKCITFIEANYIDESLDAGMMASNLAMSKAQLYRKIKALTGLTPHLLIRNYRLKRARQMIKENKYSVSEIIYMTGFNNRTYFYRSYKGTFGETPGEMNRAGESDLPFPLPGYQDESLS